MANYKPISRDHFGNKFWKPQSKYAFAASDAVVPLNADELVRAVLSLPVAFIAAGEHFALGAVLGLKTGENLLVAPDGRWIGRYGPLVLHQHPFTFMPTGPDKEILCFDVDSGLVSDGPDGNRFFEHDGKLTEATEKALSRLETISTSRKQTLRLCAQLKDHGLIKPWKITLQTPTGEHHVEGLHRIEEAALNALPGEALVELRATGALVVAYFQLLSQQHLAVLGELAKAKAEAASRALPVNAAGELDLEFMNDGPLLDFSRLK